MLNNKLEWIEILANQNGLKTAARIAELSALWPQIVSPLLASMSRVSSLCNHVLIIEVAAPVISQELSIISLQLIEKINYSFPVNHILEIRFIPGLFVKNKHSPRISLSQQEKKSVVADIGHLFKDNLGVSLQRLVNAAQMRAEQDLQDGAVRCRLCGCPASVPVDGVCSGCRFDGSLSNQPSSKKENSS